MKKTKLDKYIDAWNLVVSAQSKVSIQLSGCGLSIKDQRKLAPLQRDAFEALTKLEQAIDAMVQTERVKYVGGAK